MRKLGIRQLELLRELVARGSIDVMSLNMAEYRRMLDLRNRNLAIFSMQHARWYPTDYGREVAGA